MGRQVWICASVCLCVRLLLYVCVLLRVVVRLLMYVCVWMCVSQYKLHSWIYEAMHKIALSYTVKPIMAQNQIILYFITIFFVISCWKYTGPSISGVSSHSVTHQHTASSRLHSTSNELMPIDWLLHCSVKIGVSLPQYSARFR